MFWIIASAIGLIAALAIAWPLIRQGSSARSYALALTVLVPVLALYLYNKVGTPDGINIVGTPQAAEEASHSQASDEQINELTAQLEQRLQENPEDTQGWMLLGRTYKTMRQFDRAEAALVKAYDLEPENALVVAELAEARLFNAGSQVIGPDIQLMLVRALELDPNQQKSLWLLGFAASQAGDDSSAIEYWERLLSQMDPAAETSAGVRSQIDEARSRLGLQVSNQWAGFDIEVKFQDDAYVVPVGAVLFVVARKPGVAGPPLGVKRIANPDFPVRIRLSDADSMMKELPVSGASSVQLQARLSLGGAVTAGENDPASELLVAEVNSTEPIRLDLQVPGQ